MTDTDNDRAPGYWTERLSRVIPGGAHTYSKGADQYPVTAPGILARGEGAYVWDPDGNRFLDYGMGLRSVTLGYGYQPVIDAAFQAMLRGNNLSRPTTIELEAAERLIGLIDAADMVKFAKNGSNVTTAAVKLARAFTGRDLVAVPRQHPFFSFDDWFIGSTVVKRGVPRQLADLTLPFDYGDISSLERLFAENPGAISCVILEPATAHVPCPDGCSSLREGHRCAGCPRIQSNFLFEVQNLCQKEGALFVLDEMITGFRWDLRGAQAMFDVTPDLSTFGKAMANGFSVAALVGRREVMELGGIDPSGMERTFLLSTTHGAEMSSLGAFLATVDAYEELDVCTHLWQYCRQMRVGFESQIAAAGLNDYIQLVGPDIGLELVTRDPAGERSMGFRTLFLQEMARAGVLMPALLASRAHGPAELAVTLEALSSTLKVYAQALEVGVDGLLEGPEVKPVFRRTN